MKYFIDTEFLEGTQNKNFLGMNVGKTKPTIDLISIGIISDDGREYYAISKDFNLKEAWNRWQYDEKLVSGKNQQGKYYWLRENVLKPIYKELYDKECLYAREALRKANVYIPEPKFDFTYRNLKKLINKYGKTNKQIANEIVKFIYGDSCNLDGLSPLQEAQKYEPNPNISKPEFYAYYADYDWVVFCWLFGKMIDLPKGFPMYCIDLKQILDEKANSFTSEELSKLVYPTCTHNVFALLGDSKFNLTHLYCLKSHANFPKQINEHNALSDARWNKQLHEFLNTL